MFYKVISLSRTPTQHIIEKTVKFKASVLALQLQTLHIPHTHSNIQPVREQHFTISHIYKPVLYKHKQSFFLALRHRAAHSQMHPHPCSAFPCQAQNHLYANHIVYIFLMQEGQSKLSRVKQDEQPCLPTHMLSAT